MKIREKLLAVLLVLVLLFASVACDDGSKNVPEDYAWDGTTQDTSWYDKSKSEFTLTKASQLAGLAKLVNEGDTFSGKTITLGGDINLNSKQWTPIGLYHDENDTSDFGKKPFSGTFDGKNYTISGLSIDLDNGKSSYRALFGYADGTVSNFTVKGEVKANSSSGVVAALGDGGKIENVVSYVNVSVTKGADKGGLHAKIAGIVVAVKGETKGCTITNCKNYGAITSTVTTANDAVGGILAWTNIKTLTITGCENYGTITAEDTKQNAGGIIGAIWNISKNDGDTIKYTITNCKNDAKIEGNNATDAYYGGIIGREYPGLNLNLELSKNSCTTTGDYNLIGNIKDSTTKS